MLSIKNILVVMERRRERQLAWEAAVPLSRATGAVLHAFLPALVDEPVALKVGAGLEQGLRHTAELEGERWLAEHLAMQAGNAAYQSHVAATHQWGEAIVHEARRVEAGLIVVCCPEGQERQWLWLLRHLPCPAYLVHKAEPPRRVAAAVSAGVEDERHRLLNDAVLERAVAWRQLFGAELSVVSALPSPLEYAPLVGEAYAVGYAEQELEAALRVSLEQLVARFGIAPAQVRTRLGPVDEVLASEVEDQRLDCLVLGTVSRQALAAFLLGNTAESVVARVTCNVLLLRPQDYEVPEV